MVEFRLLGDVDVWQDGSRVALGAKQRAVLAVLAFHANSVVSRPDMVRLAWGSGVGDPPTTIDRLVTDYVSRLRTVFRAAGIGEQARLVARPPGRLLEVDPTAVDWHRFRDLVARARVARRVADDADAAELLRKGLGLWRGPALADLDDRSLQPIRAQMGDLRLAAAEDLATVQLTHGRPEEVLDLLTELATGHPGRERLADDAYRGVLHGQAATLAPDGDRRLAQLPAATGTFTGRRAELTHLLDLISDTVSDPCPGAVVAICAVDGMGGVGKPNPGN